jgi:hypothetical protein
MSPPATSDRTDERHLRPDAGGMLGRMTPARLSFPALAGRTVVVHTITYMLMGVLAASLLDYEEVFRRPTMACWMRPLSDPFVMFGPLLQPLRGIAFALVLVRDRDDGVKHRFERPRRGAERIDDPTATSATAWGRATSRAVRACEQSEERQREREGEQRYQQHPTSGIQGRFQQPD